MGLIGYQAIPRPSLLVPVCWRKAWQFYTSIAPYIFKEIQISILIKWLDIFWSTIHRKEDTNSIRNNNNFGKNIEYFIVMADVVTQPPFCIHNFYCNIFAVAKNNAFSGVGCNNISIGSKVLWNNFQSQSSGSNMLAEGITILHFFAPRIVYEILILILIEEVNDLVNWWPCCLNYENIGIVIILFHKHIRISEFIAQLEN